MYVSVLSSALMFLYSGCRNKNDEVSRVQHTFFSFSIP
jgi:hypothetical protein